MHPTGSPVVGSPAAFRRTLGGVLPPPPGLREFGGVSRVQAPPQPTVESFLLHAAAAAEPSCAAGCTCADPREQAGCCAELVETLVPSPIPRIGWMWTKAVHPSGIHRQSRTFPSLPAIDGVKMSKGRRSEIAGWADFLEQPLPWIALFDDRIPKELHRAIASEVTIKQSSLDKGQSVRSTRTFLYLKQSLQSFLRGLDVVKQVEKEQLGSPAGYECMRRLHQELSVASRIEASTLRNEALQYRSNTPANRLLDMFRFIQLEIAKFSRLTAGFPDLALSEADRCMVVLRNLDVEVKKYVLLHARVDSMEQLETALKFYDANLKILTFQEKDGKGAKEHANALTFDDKGKGKKGDKGKEKGKEKTRTARTEKERKKGKMERESLERTRTARTKEREVPRRTVARVLGATRTRTRRKRNA